MGQTTVTWLKKMQFVGTDSTKHSIVMSSSDAENGVGMKPSELLLIALGGCTGYDVANVLQKKRQKLSDLTITLESEQSSEPPWAFQKIHIHYKVVGQGVDPKAVEQAIKLSEEKYCSVSATLKPAVDITYDFEVIDDSD